MWLYKNNNVGLDTTIYFNKHDSVSRIVTGFALLHKAKKLNVSFVENKDDLVKIPSISVLEARLCGKRIAFDMGDRSSLNHDDGIKYLMEVDMYFERSHDPKLISKLPSEVQEKVKPFGFNYYTTFPGNPVQNKGNSIQSQLCQLAKDISGYSRCMYVDAFEKKADFKETDLRIIFMARLWDPGEIEIKDNMPEHIRDYREYMIEERRIINRNRIEIIRSLKNQYGTSFAGGIQYSEFASRQCPDILIPMHLTRKKTYIQAMQNSDICIGSTGLHNSIGWKTGEYVAASRAIVAEKLKYVVTGDFEEGTNYLPFDTVEECLAAVDRLYKDPSAVYSMKLANQKYYREYLRPEQQIVKALGQCIPFYMNDI